MPRKAHPSLRRRAFTIALRLGLLSVVLVPTGLAGAAVIATLGDGAPPTAMVRLPLDTASGRLQAPHPAGLSITDVDLADLQLAYAAPETPAEGSARPSHVPEDVAPSTHAGSRSPVGQPEEQDQSVAEDVNAVPAPLPPHVLTVRRGDTLSVVLARGGVTNAEAIEVITAIRTVFNPRSLTPGQTVTVTHSDEQTFPRIEIAIGPVETVVVAPSETGSAKASVERAPTRRVLRLIEQSIRGSLYETVAGSGVPLAVTAAAVKALSADVDFQRDIHPGDHLVLFYETEETEDGTPIGAGRPVMISLAGKSVDTKMYAWNKGGREQWFREDGTSARRMLLKTPVDGARISSNYGMRKHPILGYNRKHSGMDFAAPTGTKIYAAGDGVITRIGRNGGYGNYIKIRHNGQFSTAYAHLHGFAKNLKKGSRVRQGQVIGYVGSTGRSTGPHLHYEVIKAGAKIDPRKVGAGIPDKLIGEELAAFAAHIAETKTTMARVADEGEIVLAARP